MAKVGVNLKINVSKIEKERLFRGEKGSYLDATVFIDLDEADQYGNNGMIVQAVSKEEKEQGERGPILGNCRIFWRDEQPSNQAPSQPPMQQPPQQNNGVPDTPKDIDDDIPF